MRRMLLRSCSPEDMQTLFEIDSVCFPDGVAYSFRELEFFITHRNSKTWVAEENGGVAGFLVAQQAPHRSVHIITIDVVKNARRRGVGAALMDAAEAWAAGQGAVVVTLETAEDNLAAQAFYKKRGYGKVEKIYDYYMKGMSAWVMVKRLKPKE